MIDHHGGAGTTSAGLRAGIPHVVVPFTADQPFWGMRVQALGVGTKSVYVNKLSVEKLSNAIVEAEERIILERAQALGQRVRSEFGVQYTVSLIESSLSRFRNFKVQLSDNH